MATGKDVKAILDTALDCKEKIEVRQAAHILVGTLDMMAQDNRSILGAIKEELGDRAVRAIIMSIIGSYIGSLYANAVCKSMEDAIELAKKFHSEEVKTENGQEIDINSQPHQA